MVRGIDRSVMAEADQIEMLAQIEAGDKITFGDRKQPLEVKSHNRKINADGLDGFYCTVEGSRGGTYKLDTKKLHRDDPYFQIYRLDKGILENEWQKNGRASIDSFQLVEKGDYEYSEEEQHLLSFDIGQKVHLDLGDGKTATGTVSRFEVSSRTVTLWVHDDEQDPDKTYSNTYSISPPDIIHDHIHANFHPDEFQADLVNYDQVTISDTPATPNDADPDTDPEVATDGGETPADVLERIETDLQKIEVTFENGDQITVQVQDRSTYQWTDELGNSHDGISVELLPVDPETSHPDHDVELYNADFSPEGDRTVEAVGWFFDNAEYQMTNTREIVAVEPSEDKEVVTDGGVDVIDQLLDLEAGDDVVITADGRDLHGQVVDHFVERFEESGYYGDLMIDIELAERHVDGETIKGYGLTIAATEKRSGWVHFHADIVYHDPDSEQYGLQDMTPITNVRMEREDEFPRDLDRDADGYPEGAEEIELLGKSFTVQGSKLGYSTKNGSELGNTVGRTLEIEAIESLLDNRKYSENGTTVGWAYADPETGGIREIWIEDQYLKSDPDYSACSHQIVVYSHQGTGSYRLASSGDQPEIMADGGERRVPEKGERALMAYYSERAGRVIRVEGEVDHASRCKSRVYADDELPEPGNGHMEDGIHGYIIEDGSGRKLSFNTASFRAGSFGDEQFTPLGDLVSIDFEGDAADPTFPRELADGEK